MAFRPFDLLRESDYRAWRERKLEAHPRTLEDLVVRIHDPRSLSAAEHAALLSLCRRANMAIYVSETGRDADRAIPRELGRQFGLERLDTNMLADEDGITSLAVRESGERSHYIPYTERPIKWHTDGYYNPADGQIRGLLLHCVNDAAEGGDNQLMDHEMAYLLLRDENPEYIAALMEPDAMTIPARMDEEGIARPDEAGPVFSVHPITGDLHMRYTARTRSIRWKESETVRHAVAALERILAGTSPFIFRGRLLPGMGLLSNNVLHDRSGFKDSGPHKRLLYRARYYDRIAGTSVSNL